MNLKSLRWSAFILALGSLLIAQSLNAQETRTSNPATMDFGNTRWFPSFWGPYTSPYVPQPKMSNSERLHSLISGGKLRLSVEDALALALENNLDISVARYNMGFAQTRPLACQERRRNPRGSGRILLLGVVFGSDRQRRQQHQQRQHD